MKPLLLIAVILLGFVPAYYAFGISMKLLWIVIGTIAVSVSAAFVHSYIRFYRRVKKEVIDEPFDRAVEGLQHDIALLEYDIALRELRGEDGSKPTVN